MLRPDEVDREDAVLDEREQDPGVELQSVVRRAWVHGRDYSELAAADLDHGKALEIGDVVRVRLERRKRVTPDGELRSALDDSIELDRAPAAAHSAREHDDRGLAVDFQRRADLEPSRIVARPLDDECAVESVRAPDAADHDLIITRPIITSLAQRRAPSVGDLEQEPSVGPGARGADEAAKSTGEPSSAPDHLADVVGCDVEVEDDGVVTFLGLHSHGVGVVDEPPGDPLEKLGHEARNRPLLESPLSRPFRRP